MADPEATGSTDPAAPPALPPIEPPDFSIDTEKNQFSVRVLVYKLDDQEAVLRDADLKPITEKDLGMFTFRLPTIGEFVDINVRVAERLRGMHVFLEPLMYRFGEAMETLPVVTTTLPQGWVWGKLVYPTHMRAVSAVYREYTAGLSRFRE